MWDLNLQRARTTRHPESSSERNRDRPTAIADAIRGCAADGGGTRVADQHVAMAGIGALVSSMQAQWYRHEVLANDLANASTPGFKRDDIAVLPAALESSPIRPLGANVSNIGAHTLVPWTDLSQGLVRDTGRSLDFALNGPGFFVVQTAAGPRYTRGGAFTVSREGYLATASGNPVLGNGGPIVIGSDRVTVSPRGEIQRDGAILGQLRIVDFARPAPLTKEGDGLFVAEAGTEPQPATSAEVVGGALESANVNSVDVMVSMVDLFRRYEAAQRAIQAVDESSRQATAEIGKV